MTLANEQYTRDYKPINHMKTILYLFIALSGLSHAGVLSLHKVVKKDAKGAIQYNLNKEVILLEKTPFISEDMVQQAKVRPNKINHIVITLNKAGTRKMHEVTGAMNHGVDRVGILVNGKITQAPVVNAQLGSVFEVALPETFTLGEAIAFINALNNAP